MSSTRLTFIPPGHELLEAIAKFAEADGWLQGVGYVDGAELKVATETAETVTRLHGRYNLLSLVGPRSGPFTNTLARKSEAGIQVFGGELVSSRSSGVNLSLLLTAPTRGTHVPAVSAASAPSAPIPMPVRPGSGATWAGAAAASAQNRGEEEHVEHIPEEGDLVQHFAFGLCEVLTSDGERLRIRDLEGPKRIREVALSMLKVMPPTESDGKKLYQLVRRGPGA